MLQLPFLGFHGPFTKLPCGDRHLRLHHRNLTVSIKSWPLPVPSDLEPSSCRRRVVWWEDTWEFTSQGPTLPCIRHDDDDDDERLAQSHKARFRVLLYTIPFCLAHVSCIMRITAVILHLLCLMALAAIQLSAVANNFRRIKAGQPFPVSYDRPLYDANSLSCISQQVDVDVLCRCPTNQKRICKSYAPNVLLRGSSHSMAYYQESRLLHPHPRYCIFNLGCQNVQFGRPKAMPEQPLAPIAQVLPSLPLQPQFSSQRGAGQ